VPSSTSAGCAPLRRLLVVVVVLVVVAWARPAAVATCCAPAAAAACMLLGFLCLLLIRLSAGQEMAALVTGMWVSCSQQQCVFRERS
jgi:hypothetical protein